MGHIQILTSNPNTKLSALFKKHLLIDTNFIIDASRYISKFKILREKLDIWGFTFISIKAIPLVK